MQVAALVLAAGAASRFGADKRRVVLRSGQTVLAASLAIYRRASLPCTVVLDHQDEELAAQLDGMGVDVVPVASRRAPLGMGDSLAAGIRQVRDRPCDACLIALADMPWIADSTVQAVVDALTRHAIVVPAWRGQPGHPVGFRARYFDELAQLSGDRGARTVLQRHAAEYRLLSVSDPNVLRDIDTPADLDSAGD